MYKQFAKLAARFDNYEYIAFDNRINMYPGFSTVIHSLSTWTMTS